MPRFSIVIPTHNRPNLIGHAVRSALSQQHDDFEVVVCDNSSDDATQEALCHLRDDRLRIVRPAAVLPMHANWCFALTHAHGEWITYLCDDDALIPEALGCVERAGCETDADLLCWRMSFYGYPDVFDEPQRDVCRIGAYSDAAYAIDAGAAIDAAYDMRITLNDIVPRMLNTVVHRRVIQEAAVAGMPLFRPSCPDYSAMLAMLLTARSPVFLDAPLSIGGLSQQSIGTSSLHAGDAAGDFIHQVRESTPELKLLPAMVGTRMWIAQTYAQCAEEYPPLGSRSVNLAHACGHALRELRGLADEGHDTRAEVKIVREQVERLWCEDRDVITSIERGERVLETESFLSPAPIATSVLGTDSFVARGGLAHEAGFADIAELAAGFTSWLKDQAIVGQALARAIEHVAGGRQSVLFGMGHQGRALARVIQTTGDARSLGICWHDDADCDLCHRLPRLTTSDTLSAERHCVIVTPLRYNGIAGKLRSSGMRHGVDWLHMTELQGVTTDTGSASSKVSSVVQT